jgi:hypothetical protein
MDPVIVYVPVRVQNGSESLGLNALDKRTPTRSSKINSLIYIFADVSEVGCFREVGK